MQILELFFEKKIIIVLSKHMIQLYFIFGKYQCGSRVENRMNEVGIIWEDELQG